MRILVTGGAGYIGSHTVKLLRMSGHEPVVLDSLVNGHKWAVTGCPLVVGDVGDAPLVRRILQEYAVEAVIHFAAFAYVGESQVDPRRYFDNNVANSLALLGAMLDENVRRIVFSSSCATYGLPAALPIHEDQPQNPVNYYGWTKLMIEKALESYGIAYGLEWLVLRYFNAAGADLEGELGEDHSPETHLLPLLIQAAMGQRPEVEIFGSDYPTPDGTAIRDYVHVADLANAHVKGWEYLASAATPVALNLGTGKGHSIRDAILAIETACGTRVPFRYGPRREGDPPELVADSARANAVLGWKPVHSALETIVTSAWRWHANRGVLK
jgi:UDP-arabinose 4-epimerase